MNPLGPRLLHFWKEDKLEKFSLSKIFSYKDAFISSKIAFSKRLITLRISEIGHHVDSLNKLEKKTLSFLNYRTNLGHLAPFLVLYFPDGINHSSKYGEYVK
jgi:hypothetical protein